MERGLIQEGVRYAVSPRRVRGGWVDVISVPESGPVLARTPSGDRVQLDLRAIKAPLAQFEEDRLLRERVDGWARQAQSLLAGRSTAVQVTGPDSALRVELRCASYEAGVFAFLDPSVMVSVTAQWDDPAGHADLMRRAQALQGRLSVRRSPLHHPGIVSINDRGVRIDAYARDVLPMLDACELNCPVAIRAVVAGTQLPAMLLDTAEQEQGDGISVEDALFAF